MDARIKSGHDGSVLWRAVKGHFNFQNSRQRHCSNSRYACATPRRDAPESCIYLSPHGGRGECRVPVAPAASCALVLVESTRVTTSTPESPGIPARNGFNSYVALSPVTGLFCHRRPRISGLSAPGRADLPSAKLDASVGASGPHDFAVRDQHLSSARLVIAHRSLDPPCDPLARKTLPRPPPPHPASVTIAIRPSGGVGWQEFVEMICPTGEAKYFCKQGWTPLSTNRPTGKSLDCGESNFLSCPGRGAAFFTLLRRAGT
jgi:hypothetical protein